MEETPDPDLNAYKSRNLREYETLKTPQSAVNSDEQQKLPSLVHSHQHIGKGKVVKSKMHLGVDTGSQTHLAEDDAVELAHTENSDRQEGIAPLYTPAQPYDNLNDNKASPAPKNVQQVKVSKSSQSRNDIVLRPKQFAELQSRLISLH